MSKINVDAWEPESGTAATLMATGDTVTVPSGAELDIASGATLDVNGTIDITGATATGFPSAGFAGVDATTATGSTTYTVPTDITKLLVFITGGGGGGGTGVVSSTNGTGGGAAGTVIARVTVVAADTITIAIGAAGTAATVGGDSTFTHASGSGSGSMSTITAPGGRPGVTNALISAPTAPTVGSSNEGIAIKGGSPPGSAADANGGSASFWGGGGQGARQPTGHAPSVAVAFGAGGGGGSYDASYLTGAAGADGICFIMEFK